MARVHCDADLSDIGGKEAAAVFPRKHTAGFDSLSVLGIESDDSIGFGKGMPPLYIGEVAPVG